MTNCWDNSRQAIGLKASTYLHIKAKCDFYIIRMGISFIIDVK
jgi:hypothetical protein